MFQTKTMSKEDFEFAVRITNQMGWNLARDDFEFAMELEPKGCFVMFYNSERVGLATTISFGRIGWFGNLVVSKNCRRKGAGSLLVQHSIKYLKSKEVKTIGLYAYMDKIPFYKRLGFNYDSNFIVLKGKGFPSLVKANIRQAKEHDVKEIIDYDSACFGASRKKLLEPIILYPTNLCYLYNDDGQVSGYAVAKVYNGMAELGPLMCPHEHSDVAVELLKATLDSVNGHEVHMCVPQKESLIIDMLKRAGFSESFRVARLFLGPPITEQSISLAESLERG